MKLCLLSYSALPVVGTYDKKINRVHRAPKFEIATV